MNSPSIPSLARFAGLAAATILVVCAVGAWPTHALSGSGGFVAMAIAAVLTFVGSVGGYLPILSRAASGSIEARAQAWMIGLGIRLFLTLGVLLAFWAAGFAQREALLIWASALYVVLLAVETVVVARTLRVANPSGTSA